MNRANFKLCRQATYNKLFRDGSAQNRIFETAVRADKLPRYVVCLDKRQMLFRKTVRKKNHATPQGNKICIYSDTVICSALKNAKSGLIIRTTPADNINYEDMCGAKRVVDNCDNMNII